MKHNYLIKYKNVVLRALNEDDIEYLRTWRNDNNNSKFLRQIPYITKESQKKWYENYLNNDNEICFAIEECEELNRVVGSLSLYDFEEDTAEFGKILIGDQCAHGKQIGYHATVAALNFAFETLKLKEVKLEVYENNIPAVKTYEKAGFTNRTFLREDDIGRAFSYSVKA